MSFLFAQCEASGGPGGDVRRGLDAASNETVTRILAIVDRKEFDAAVERVATSGDDNTFLVLTHVMFELPWVSELVPKHRGDLRMRKVALENRLDRLGHPERLSAQYLRAAIKSRGSVHDAKKKLTDWYVENKYRQEWLSDRGYFRFRSTKKHPKGHEGH